VIIITFAGFQIVEDLVNELSTKNIYAKKPVSLAESMMLRKFGREGSETLAIA
jgi:hypothetical protein